MALGFGQILAGKGGGGGGKGGAGGGNRPKTGFFINKIPVEFAEAVEFRPFSRGVEPWKMAVPVSDDRFDQLRNPLTITLKAPDEDGNLKEYEFKNWYVTSRVPKSEEMDELIIQDIRWKAQYDKFTWGFNIKWWGEEDKWRQDSLNIKGEPWTCYDAAKFALSQGFKMPVVDDPNFPAALKKIELPQNLGNSEGGGFFEASILEMLPLLLEPIRCDVTINKDGKVFITDRNIKNSDALLRQPVLGGRAAPKDQSWSRPENIIISYQKRIEIPLTYDEAEYARSTRALAGDEPELELEMVIPKIDGVTVQDPPHDEGNFDTLLKILPSARVDEVKHEEWYRTIQSIIGYTRPNVLKYIRKPAIFDIENRTSAQQYWLENYYETLMKATWRQRFRIRKDALGNDRIRRPYASIRLGRLTATGENNENGYIFSDYTRINRFSNYPAGKGPAKGGSIFDAEFSNNIEFDISAPAPFDATWVSTKSDELIFDVVPRIPFHIMDIEYWPGLLKKKMRYGDVNDIAAGKPIEVVESTLEFLPTYRLVVMMNGLQIADLAGSVKNHEITIPTPNPSSLNVGPDLYLRVDDITANYRFVNWKGFPGDLMNDIELQERAEDVARQVIETYKGERSGVVMYDGLWAIEKAQTGGDIYDVVVQIGYHAAHTITTSFMILPEVKPVNTNRVDMQGTAPRLVEE